jgi:hypothetical protein
MLYREKSFLAEKVDGALLYICELESGEGGEVYTHNFHMQIVNWSCNNFLQAQIRNTGWEEGGREGGK